jgi:DNA-directed RNA polymerase specialized sigma24 family protein
MTKTPSNGRHSFFRQPEGYVIGNSVGRLGNGIDVRASGGCIVAPGALLPTGGGWLPLAETPELAATYCANLIPPLPPWLVALIVNGPRQSEESSEQESTEQFQTDNQGRREKSYAEGALRRCSAELRTTPVGARNSKLNAAAYKLGRMVARGWIGQADVVDALRSACVENGLVGDDGIRAFESTINSGLQAGLQDPHPDPDDSGESYRQQSARDEQGTRLAPITLDALLCMPIPPREYLIEFLIHVRGLVMIYAWRGIGKTWFALALGYAIATGGSYLKWTARKPRRVLHVCGEMPAGDLKERLLQVVAASKTTTLPDPTYYRILSADLHETGLPDLATPEGQAAMDAVIGNAEVIIFDNVSTLFRSGQENESQSWIPVQKWLLELRRQGRTVNLVHHANKSGAQRGTSKREDVLDLVVNLREPSDFEAGEGARFEVHFEKARGLTGTDHVSPFEAKLELRDGAAMWTYRDIEDARRAEILELKKEGLSIRQISEKLGISKSTVQRVLKTAGTS